MKSTFTSVVVCVLFAGVSWGQTTATGNLDALYRTIRTEAIRKTNDSEGRPLPLLGHWHTGTTVKGYGPAYQMKLLDKGYPIIPWFIMPMVGDDKIRIDYYEPLIKRAAAAKLPLVFVSTQWERLLSVNREYFQLPPDKNPNVIKTDGSIERKVSPFGAVEPWRDLGRRWGSHPMLAKIQEWYPDPPLVIFLSNNEHAKLRWKDVETCKTYVDRFGAGLPDERKRELVSKGWSERYPVLLEGLREGLASSTWRANAIFVGYNAFPPSFMGRWAGWQAHSLPSGKQLSVWPTIWNGASVPFYTHPWDGSTDCNTWSAQTEAMNWAAFQTLLPPEQSFWFEMSTWDGNVPGKPNDKRLQYERSGQKYSPERYEGMVQYGLWLLMPRSVREFRAHNETLESTEPYFLAVARSVDRVHRTDELREFWRRGELVPNSSRPHPYQTIIPPEIEKTPRWFRLDTNLDPPGKWKLHTELAVFPLALVLGERPNRRWLLYAHAPMGAKDSVQITISDGPKVTVDVPLAGAFWVVEESNETPRLVFDTPSAAR